MAHQSLTSREIGENKGNLMIELLNSNRACCGVIHGDRFWRIYLPKDQVLTIAQQAGGTPYDIDAMEFTHEGERCSFDTILRIYILRICDIRDPALHHLATIVRGADTSRHDLGPQCGGLFAISLGLSANFPDDHEMLKHGMASNVPQETLRQLNRG